MNVAQALRLGAQLAVLIGAVAAASCGGSGSTAPPAAAPTGTPTPAGGGTTPIPSAAPTSVATTGTFGATVTFPTVAGYGLSLLSTGAAIPSPATAAVALVGYNYAPAGVPPNPPAVQPSPVGDTATVLAAWTFTAAGNGQISLAAPGPGAIFTGLSPAPAQTSYFSYFADVTAALSFGYGFNTAAGTGFQESGGMVNFPANAPGTTVILEGHTYVLELVYF